MLQKKGQLILNFNFENTKLCLKFVYITLRYYSIQKIICRDAFFQIITETNFQLNFTTYPIVPTSLNIFTYITLLFDNFLTTPNAKNFHVFHCCTEVSICNFDLDLELQINVIHTQRDKSNLYIFDSHLNKFYPFSFLLIRWYPLITFYRHFSAMAALFIDNLQVIMSCFPMTTHKKPINKVM